MANADQQQHPDTREPSDERKAELEAAYEAQKGTDAPYKDVQIRTLDELQWIMQQRRWSGEEDLSDEMERVNLTGANLFLANLTNAHLTGATLTGADLSNANLTDANLFLANLTNTNIANANLTNANLGGANLMNANLANANLTKAHLVGANLANADLSLANLTNAALSSVNLTSADLAYANLTGVDLSNAALTSANFNSATLSGGDLTRALLNAETVLDDITLDIKTKVFGTRWNGAPLDGIDWIKVSRLGDEPTTEDLAKKKAGEKAARYRDATRAYHGFVVALRDQGLTTPASTYRLRELVMERKALRYERNFGGWLLNVILGAVAGHGEKPGRALVAYIGIITTFALTFWGVTNFLHTGAQPLQWYEAAVLSISSFHGRGFFTSTIQLGDPLAIVAAFEAVFGLFIELVFIATFSRRFLGD